MKTFIAFMTVSVGVLLSNGVAHAQGREEAPVAITQLMSAGELQATGLRALTEDQLDALSTWLEDYRVAIERLALDPTSEDSMEDWTVESRIDGDFDGWVGDSVFRLKNGQVWQQVSPSARYLFAHEPKVVITPAPHTMKVEGVPVQIAVRRLR